MSDREFLQVDPATLHLPGGRRDGVDPMKLHRQMARHGMSVAGMPPLEVSLGIDGELVINDGMTRATRVAQYFPGTPVTVEVTGALPVAVDGGLPTVKERL
jgi:hypothetical protein